jgi:hypothetical protein
VQQAHRPDYADVLRRAARRRTKVRAAGAALAAVGVAAGGGTAVALTGDSGPVPKVVPSPTPGPWRTEPGPGSRSPAPQPSYTQIAPDAWDVTERDVPLTGMWTQMLAGDLDHLYLEYQDCAGRDCTRMLAASEDGGRTWRKLRMPDVLDDNEGTTIVAARGRAVVARNSERSRQALAVDPGAPYPASAYWTSVDGGVTWRQPNVRTVDALPAGWAVFGPRETGTMAAVDPATGDIARVMPAALRGYYFAPLRVPAAAGIWLTQLTPVDRPTENLIGHAMISRDGGRTWTERRLPKALLGGNFIYGEKRLTTADGRTVYGLDERGDSVRVFVSTDGGATWHGRGLVDLDGPVLSLLPTADGALVIEGTTATFRSTDGGRSFARVGPSLGAQAHPVAGGYAIPTNNNEYGVWLSRDGARWWYVGRPDVP